MKIFAAIAFVIGSLFIASPAQAVPGDEPQNPIIIRDPGVIPDNPEPDFLVVGCKIYYTWSVYSEEEQKIIYFSYIDDTACFVQVTPRVTVVDRCGWRRDVVRVGDDTRIKSVLIDQVKRRKWVVKIEVEEGHILTKTWTTKASYTYWLTNRRC